MWYLNQYIVYIVTILLISCQLWNCGNCLTNDTGAEQNDLYSPSKVVSVPGIISNYGYPCEIHETTTEDGFTLTLFRIPGEKILRNSTKKKRKRRQPVLLVHGIMADAGAFFFKENQSLPFLLADRGYDVWLFNARGSMYSLKHVKYKPHEENFWKWSWEEMAEYDLPATLEYISTEIKQFGNILYVSHSMGATVFHALMSSKPKYNSYVKATFSLGPVVYMKNVRGLFTTLVNYADVLNDFFAAIRFETTQTTVLPVVKNYIKTFCKKEKVFCGNFLFSLVGFDREQTDLDKIPFYISHIPSSLSVRTILHYVQQVKSSKFQRYDYGVEGNLEKYGKMTPPVYNISKTTVPVAIYWEKNDFFGNEKDCAQLWSEIKNKIISYEVPYKNFNHFGFISSRNVKSVLYDKLLEHMRKYS